MINSGIIFRSDELTKLKKSVIKTLLDLNIKTVLDLRTINEAKLRPHNIVTNCNINIIHVPFTYDQRELGLFRFLWYLIIKSNKFSFADMIKNYYRAIAFNNTDQVKKVFKIISKKNNLPVLIHCVSGKDRTGFIIAVIYKLLSVPDKLIMQDYLQSNRNIKPKLDKFLKYTKWMNFHQLSAERVNAMLAQREYLDFVFSEIENRFRSIDQYVIRGCGVEKEDIENVKQLLLSNRNDL